MNGHITSVALTAASWLLTYAVHSTFFLGLAWLFGKLLGSRRLALQELVWRAAIVGGLLTASLQVALGVGGAFDLSTIARTATPAIAESSSPLVLEEQSATPVEPTTATGIPSQGETGVAWPLLFVLLWVAGSAVCVVRVGRASLDLQRLLSDRLPVSGGPLAAALTRLIRLLPERPRVALSSSRALPLPIAVGIRRPEICVPERALADLPPAQQEGLCAHELAHLVRRDPVWSMALAVIEGVLFFQPLNRVARRRLGEIAEFRCDDWAARSTGKRHDLAQCLATVAEWNCGRSALPAASLLGSSRLARRVRRLVSGDGDLDRIGRPRGAAVAAGALLLGLGMVLPGVGLARSSWAMADQEPPVAVAPVAPAPAPAPAAAPAPAPVPEPEQPQEVKQEKKTEKKRLERIEEKRLQEIEEMRRAKIKLHFDEATAAEMQRLEEEIQSLSEEIQKRAQSIEQIHLPLKEQQQQFEAQQKLHEEMARRLEKELEAIKLPEVDTSGLEAEIQQLSEKLEQARLEKVDPAQEAKIRKELELDIQELVAKKKPSEEALKKYREKAREIAESMKPMKEQMRQFKEQAKAMAEQMRPQREEIRKLREQIRERAQRLRELVREALERERALQGDEPPAPSEEPVPPAKVDEPSGSAEVAGNAP